MVRYLAVASGAKIFRAYCLTLVASSQGLILQMRFEGMSAHGNSESIQNRKLNT